MAKQKIDYNAINFKNKDIDRFSTKFGQGDPIKLKDSPLGSDQMKYAEKGYNKGVDPTNEFRMSVRAHDMAATAGSSVDRAKAKVALQNDKSNWSESYGFKKTSNGEVVDTKLGQQSRADARMLREMATRRPITESVNKHEKSLRGRKLAEGIQTPSMEKNKKPIIEAPKIGSKKSK